MDPVVHDARYPAVVELASLLTSTHSRHLAFNADDRNVRRFLQRVAKLSPTAATPPAAKTRSDTGVPVLRATPAVVIRACQGGQVFGDVVVAAAAAAMIDRLVHHAMVIALKGDSYRLKERDLGRVPTAAAEDN